MTGLLYLFGVTLALTSAARSVLWLCSYATPGFDQWLAGAGAVGMTAAMYLLSARAALPNTNKTALNGCATALFCLSAFASFDWAESGYQARLSASTLSTATNQATTALLQSSAELAATQTSLINAYSANAVSKKVAAGSAASATLATSAELIGAAEKRAQTTPPTTGTTAALLGEWRLILWAALAAMLDLSGMLCLRTATADSQHTNTKDTTEPDPLTETIRAEIQAGIHGTQPAVKRIAALHNQPDERIRAIFAELIDAGELCRQGIRYQRTNTEQKP